MMTDGQGGERGTGPLGRVRVVLHGGERGRDLDLRLPRRARGSGLRSDDALHGRKDARPDRWVEGADVEEELGSVRDDVARRAGVQCAHREDRHIRTSDLARDDRLEAQHHCGGHDDRIDGRLRSRSVSTLPVQDDP